jgi:uncharacterized membrane protein
MDLKQKMIEKYPVSTSTSPISNDNKKYIIAALSVLVFLCLPFIKNIITRFIKIPNKIYYSVLFVLILVTGCLLI